MHNQNLFSKRKNSYVKPLLITIGIVMILGFGFWISTDMLDGNNKNIVTENSQSKASEIEKKVDQYPITKGLAPLTDEKQEKSEEVINKIINKDEEMIEKASKSYYLVKQVDGLVKLFYYSATGDEKLIRITGITYELLSEPDQELFNIGVIKYSIDELDELLQDFES